MGGYLLDDYRVFNTGNDFYRPATVQAGLNFDPEGSLHRKQTLKHLCSNGRSGSVPAVQHGLTAAHHDAAVHEAGIGQHQSLDAFAFGRFERQLLAGIRAFAIKRPVQNGFGF